MIVRLSLLIFISIFVLRAKSAFDGFIVGGTYSKIESFPFSVFLSKVCNRVSATCGASLLTQAVLLTAAHCVYSCQVSFNITAYTGSVKKFEGFETKVVSFIMHKGYNNITKANDIAMMRLAKDVKLGPTVNRIALLRRPPKAVSAVIAGWGWINSIGTRGDLLKHAQQELIDQKTCSRLLGSTPLGTFCGKDLANYPEKGDSGSPLVIQNFIQVGLVSFKRREYSNSTIVYTDVPYFYDWIINNIESLRCEVSPDSGTPANKTKRRLKKKSHK